jgi:hypothetical protein
MVKVGDKLPAVSLIENADFKNKVDMSTLFAGKKGVLFAVPGAFTPGVAWPYVDVDYQSDLGCPTNQPSRRLRLGTAEWPQVR